MKCEKCGAQLPENEMICPECGTENTAPVEATAVHTEYTAVRAQTVPQRPRQSYPERRSERKNEESRKKSSGKVRIVILVLVIAAVLCAAIFVGYRILQNGQEEPNLGEQNNEVNTGNTTGNDDEPLNGSGEDVSGTDEPEQTESYDLAGVWVWDAESALMRETIWNFSADGTLTIHYFGMENPENPFDTWPDTYTYDQETSVLTLAGEEISIVWEDETSFSMDSEILGVCNANRTDEAHIPTGAVDIRDVESGDTDYNNTENTDEDTAVSGYIFEDSDSRYLSRTECEAYSAQELRIARNEIYARHGRLFDSEDLQEYFEAQDWYEGTISPEDFDYTVLNDYERYNVNLMKSIEDEKNA